MAFGNVRLRTFCIMSQRVAVCGKVNPLGEAEAKASLNRAKQVTCCRPETQRSIHGQAEARVRLRGGPNSPQLKMWEMTCGSE
jgi:hypothetical protein